MSDIKKIAVLTSGGDCSGLNAAIRAVVKRAHQLGWEVYGIMEGTAGFMKQPIECIKLDDSNTGIDLLKHGGTILKTINKGDPFHYKMPDGTFKDRSSEIVEGYKSLNIDAMIAIGGDGSMRIIEKLTALGNIRFIGIPKTIDNDVPFTEFPIGYMTAVEVATSNIERLHDTGLSHKRVMVAEVMGRDVGHLALSSGIAAGADVVLIPEIPYDINKVANKINEIYATGRDYAIIVCAEAAISKEGTQIYAEGQDNRRYGGVGNLIGRYIEEITGHETRVTVLGHVQRGGTPSPIDRLIATTFGTKAVDLLNEGYTRKIVGWLNRGVIAVDLDDIVNTSGAVDVEGDLVKAARGVGICFGD